jgi:hypothetical protein
VVFLPKCAKIEVVKGADGLKFPSSVSQDAASGGISFPCCCTPSEDLTKKTVRRGLPQGSVLSPLVARAFLGREIRAALGKKEVARYSFVDDLALGARSRPKVEHALDALRERLQGHPAGPILLHVNRPTSVENGRVKVFGYVLQPGRGYGGNFVHVCPHRVRFDRFHKKLYDRWKAESQPLEVEALDDFILERLARWMPSQQAWTVVPYWSRHAALGCAFIDLCERDAEEFKKLQVQKG